MSAVLYCSPLTRTACTHQFLILRSLTTHWKLEIGHCGSIYTLEISKCYRSGHLFPQKVIIKHLLAHSCIGCSEIPAVLIVSLYATFLCRRWGFSTHWNQAWPHDLLWSTECDQKYMCHFYAKTKVTCFSFPFATSWHVTDSAWVFNQSP